MNAINLNEMIYICLVAILKPYWFDLYKTKKEKLKLLNEAISTHDGNTILAVKQVFFLVYICLFQIF